MNSAQRDAVLRMMLPAGAVVVLYIFAFNEQAQLTAAYRELEGSQAAAVSDFEVLQVQENLIAENEKQAGVKKDKEAMDRRWMRLTTIRAADPAQRANALRRLNTMLWDRGLVPFEESPEAATSSQGLPSAFDEVVKKLATPGSTGGQPRLWKIRFYGRYSDVVNALSVLGETETSLVPVGLTMSEARPETDWRSWTLLLWN